MTDPIMPLRRLPRVPRFPRTLGDDNWLREKLKEASERDPRQKLDYFNVWTNQEPKDGSDPKANPAV
ncbi:hypothetical protein D3C87_331890 [compost metagenome]